MTALKTKSHEEDEFNNHGRLMFELIVPNCEKPLLMYEDGYAENIPKGFGIVNRGYATRDMEEAKETQRLRSL